MQPSELCAISLETGPTKGYQIFGINISNEKLLNTPKF